MNLEEALKVADEAVFNKTGSYLTNILTAKALEEGKLLILLDGLDEVPTKNSTNVISQIQDFVDTYDKNRFITSCRVAAYRHNFRRFTDVAMADFDDIQIENFINNWFSSKPDIGKDCWQKLNSDEYTAAKELTQTPLLLTLVCLLYQRSGKIPTNRATLYERALRVLLEEWAGEKGITQEDLYKGLDTKRKEMILSEIAHDAFQEDRLFLPRREIADKIEKLLAEMLPDQKLINGVDVLKSIEVQHGILVERADSIYSFSHLTLQEYLTAQYIDDHRQIKKLVAEHLIDKRWKEVFLLVAGLMRGGADDLLLRMEKEAQKYINTPKLQALLNWAEQITSGSPGDYKPVGKRAVAINNAIVIANANANANAYAYAYAYAIDYAIAIEYTGELEELKIFNNVNFTMLIDQLKELKDKIPDDKQPKQMHETFLQRLQQTLINAFNLSPDIINLSQEEVKALENYLYANNLLIQCKQASVLVSRPTWEEIEARMLLVPDN
ncbi:NACHT domain-containing protein [Nostoc sp.]|uniref:NACHT domain-containing protein n=1 Tax=Nostoc sp. TaxID=1180 RepID=UPI002FF9AA5D